VLVKELLLCGCFHPSGEGEDELRAAARRLRGEIELLMSRLREVLDRVGGGVEAETSIRIGDRLDRSVAEVVSRVSTFAEKVESLVARLVELTTPGTELWKAMELLRLYSFINVDLEALRGGSFIRARVLRVHVKQAASVDVELSKLEGALVVREPAAEKNYELYVLVYPAQLEQAVSDAIRRLKLQELSVPEGLPSNIAEAVKVLSEELERLPREASRYRAELVRALKALEASAEVLRILESSRLYESVAVIEGFVSERAFGSLKKRLDAALEKTYVVVGEKRVAVHGEEEGGPTEYEYPRLLRPFAELIEMYGHPRPLEIVPLALTAITLPVIFGMMFPDLGHGILLALFGLYLLIKGGESGRWLGQLVLYMAAGAMVFGFLAGEFFGADPRVAGWLTELWHGKPPYSSPVHPLVEAYVGEGHVELELVSVLVMRTIFISLGLGSALLALAAWMGVAKEAIRGERESLVAAIGRALTFTGVLTVFLGAGLLEGWDGYRVLGPILVAATGIPMEVEITAETMIVGRIALGLALLGLLTVFIAPIVFGHEESMGMRAVSGVMEVFDTILLAVGNTISFIRIMGLMLAHSSLVFGFLLIGLNAGPAWPAVYALGNLLVASLEALIATAHSLRLHFYEMYSKFYEGGGIVYLPVRLPRGVRVELAG
jgi:V/A-type H+-transporting ATPase subunit I